MLIRHGSSALSAFRCRRLTQQVTDRVGQPVSIRARFVYFVATQQALSVTNVATLDRLLSSRPETTALTGTLFLVVPRPGTLSPWSSRATDIAQLCGLQQVARIERGKAFFISGTTFSRAQWQVVAELLHDRMTETVLPDLAAAETLFARTEPVPFGMVDVLQDGVAALRQADAALGLALSDGEMDYLLTCFQQLGRNPTDVELMMFAQANSEHCRHKIFNADWMIDGTRKPRSLFDMIRHTTAQSPQGVLSAYKDNAAVIDGYTGQRFFPDADGVYTGHPETMPILLKVETHNHPTAISPGPGAATGSGGEIRDEGATGIGAKPKAGLCGFSVSDLRIPGCVQPWEKDVGKPARISSALDIMLEGPIGAAAFNNEFGRPNLTGYFRTFTSAVNGELKGYHKPIMLAGGLGNVRPQHIEKKAFPADTPLVVLGGPAMLIGLGGGAASSVASGASAEALDFASVQRANPEMERRCQEVIDQCWQRGDDNPILFIHDVGAGGLSNALPELIHDGGCGGRFDLRQVPNADPGLSPLQIWCNEAQERYVLAIAAEQLTAFADLCRRERCPYTVVGQSTEQQTIVLDDPQFTNQPIDLPLDVFLGKPPKMVRQVTSVAPYRSALALGTVSLAEAAKRVLRLPTVASKSFLITIGDRSITGLVARDQMVGPWQVPVADVAVTANDFCGFAGEAMAMGERTPLAVLDAPASGRMAVGEAITNIAAADIARLSDIKLSANWMAAAGAPGADAQLFATVEAVGIELCPALGIAIPVGKDSLSMRTVWQQDGTERSMTAPVSLIISAFAPVTDVRRTLTPQLHLDHGPTELILIDLGAGRNRLGASALAQVYGQTGDTAADLDSAAQLRAFFAVIQQLKQHDLLLAYHDRSDGGLFTTLCEMAFAGRCGLQVDLTGLDKDVLAVLFNEELGAVIQIRQAEQEVVLAQLAQAGLAACSHHIGVPQTDQQIQLRQSGSMLWETSRAALQQAWSETSYQMQRLRDHPDCADEEFARIAAEDAGLSARLTFDPYESLPLIGGTKPQIAILREQGVNGQIEMAAAFHKAGFTCVDVHMSDILAGEAVLDDFHGLVACGGFSYGDVLGAGTGWASAILFNARVRDQFAAFFDRSDTFTLGVCNGCQMLAQLRELIPGTAHWPRFVRNRSEQFEARLVQVEIQPSPSILFTGMAGSQLPIVVAHGEGRAEFADMAAWQAAQVTLRYVEHNGMVAARYPANPNGSPDGITGLCNADGRVNIMMPHPERVVRTVQHSWHPADWGEDAPWLRLFRNARYWLQ
ncbi:MAG: phosphoribosylformylglycinamidine synthase [Pseudomonadota bacterium]